MSESSSAEQKRVIIIGGHGKIALLAAPKLVSAGWGVTSVIRNPDQTSDVEQTGASALVLDVENAGLEELTEAFTGVDAVLFAAGAGGGDPQRTDAVDHQAAVRSMDAAAEAGVSRYVIISYARAEVDVHNLDESDSFYPYAKAKHLADQHLRQTDLDYTILGPGALTLEPATGTITVTDAEGAAAASEAGGSQAIETSRENVAEVIAHVLSTGAGSRKTINFFDGSTPITAAIEA